MPAVATKKKAAKPPARKRRRGAGTAATIHDVAKLARVSPITVSRAINTPGQVSAGTLERVRNAVKRTGYVPNLLAGGLSSSRSRLVAAVFPTVAGPVFLETVQALTEALDEHGYQLLLGQSGYKTSREDALLDAIIGRRPVGIVLTGTLHSADGRRRLAASGIPIVETWDLAGHPIDMQVGFSHERIGAAVAEYLHASGKRRPAAIAGDDERAQRRTDGFVRAARRLGMQAEAEPRVPVKVVPAPTTHASGRDSLAELLARHPGIDCVFCSSDLLALGVLTEAHARGIAVPSRLAVVGFGNLPFAAGVIPSLTTVHVDGQRIGRTAAHLIIDRAEGRDIADSRVDVGFSIIPRESA